MCHELIFVDCHEHQYLLGSRPCLWIQIYHLFDGIFHLEQVTIEELDARYSAVLLLESYYVRHTRADVYEKGMRCRSEI